MKDEDFLWGETDPLMDEIAEQRKLVSKSQEQIDRLLKMLEDK